MIEEWGRQHQPPIMHYDIDNDFNGIHFDHLAFQQMIQDALANRDKCIIVKGLSRLECGHITVGYYLNILFQYSELTLSLLTISLIPLTT